MKAAWFGTLAAGAAFTLAASAWQAPAIRITSPAPDAVVTGATRFEAVIEPQDAVPTVQEVTFTVDGRLACTIERPPFACAWDSGEVVRDHHVRVVATLDRRRAADGESAHGRASGTRSACAPTRCWCRSSSRARVNSCAA